MAQIAREALIITTRARPKGTLSVPATRISASLSCDALAIPVELQQFQITLPSRSTPPHFRWMFRALLFLNPYFSMHSMIVFVRRTFATADCGQRTTLPLTRAESPQTGIATEFVGMS